MKKAERIDYGTYVMTEDLGMKNQEDAKMIAKIFRYDPTVDKSRISKNMK